MKVFGITTLILKLFGHIARADQAEDALWACLNSPGNWRQPTGHPRQTWQWTLSDDLKHLNLGVHSAYCPSAGLSFVVDHGDDDDDLAFWFTLTLFRLYLKGCALICFDTVGWASGRASGL